MKIMHLGLWLWLSAVPVWAAPFTRTELPNGLRVILVPDHSLPLVSVVLRYRVGGKDDPKGRSGFAHLFEHLMFKKAGNLPNEGLDRLTEDVGGENNAFTDFDETVYYETVPSNHLERILWAEGERLRALAVDKPNFHSERAVVEQERREHFDNNPQGLQELALWHLAYDQHPYKNEIIGSIAQLEQATLGEVQAFHEAYYQPQNAVLTISGDLPDQSLDWVNKYLGSLPNRAQPPRITTVEPPLKGPRQQTLTSPLASQASVVVAYRIPDRTSPEALALQLLPYLLTDGPSSRLTRLLVTEQRVAVDLSSDPQLLESPGLFSISATATKDLAPILAGIDRVISELAKNGPTAAELIRAQTKYLTELADGQQTPLAKALALGEAEQWFRDPGRVDQEAQLIQSVTAKDLAQVLARYFTPENRVTVSLIPAS